MNKDKLKEILNDSTLLEVEVEYLADKLETFLAPVIEKAQKWDKLLKILPTDCTPDGCKIASCGYVCKQARVIRDALEGGTVVCPKCEGKQWYRKESYYGKGKPITCSVCHGIGRVKAEWAKEAERG